jgi:hypothetical protein
VNTDVGRGGRNSAGGYCWTEPKEITRRMMDKEDRGPRHATRSFSGRREATGTSPFFEGVMLKSRIGLGDFGKKCNLITSAYPLYA